MKLPVEDRTAAADRRGPGWAPPIAVLLVIAAVAGWSVYSGFANARRQAGARLEAVAEARAGLAQGWLEREMSLASFLASSSTLGGGFSLWQEQGSAAAGADLMWRSNDSRRAMDAQGFLLVDGSGRVLASEPAAETVLGAELQAAVQRAIATAAVTRTEIYRSPDATLPLRLDVVAPLLRSGTPPRGALVLRIDPHRVLFETLAAWPAPSATGATVLWGRVGDRVVSLNDLGDVPGGRAQVSEVIAGSSLPVARAMRGDVPINRAAVGVDYRGRRVLAVPRAIQGTDWWMVSKIELDEIDAPAWRSAVWIAAAASFAMAVALLLARLVRQRRALADGLRERDAQRERLHTLALLEAIAESSREAIYAKDLDGRFVFCNRAAALVVGRTPEDVIGRTNEDLFDAETAARLTACDRRATRERLPETVDELVSANGTRITMLITKGPLFDAAGQRIGMLGVSHDVTESQRAERALRASEAHHRSVVAVLSEAILVSDPQGRSLGFNPAAQRMLGLSSSEHSVEVTRIGGWQPLCADGLPMPQAETPLGRVLAGESLQRGVLVGARGPDGDLSWFEVNAAPILDPDTGALTAAVASFVDVTARRRLEADLARHRDELEELVAERTEALLGANRALEEAARFSRNITDSIPGRVAYWDAELRCRFANRAFAAWFGKTPEQVVGRTALEIFGAEAVAGVQLRIDAVLRGEPQHFDNPTRRPDGSVAWNQVHYLPESAVDGAPRGVFVMGFDITELKNAEARLRELNDALALSRDEAQTANRAKSAFLANMSHEIRTPMNAIIGLTHLLARDSRDALQRDRLGKVSTAAKHLLGVINDILDLSKIEAGKLVLDDTEFSVPAMLAWATEMVGARARDKALELVVDADGLPARLRGDSLRLSQVLINLLSNAVKFTEHGWVRLSARVVDDSGARLLVRFEVRDTGPGIPLERQAALFAAFEQADNSISRVHGGTGLGLALSRKLAQAMDGDAGVVSAPGAGSTFWFSASLGRAAQCAPTLPDDAAADDDAGFPGIASRWAELEAIAGAGELRSFEADAVVPRPPAPQGPAVGDAEALLRERHRGQRVLLAEDNPVNREVAEELMQSVGLVVEAAVNGARAVELAVSRHYDLILMDMQMPLMDGLDATRAIRSQTGHATPIVAMTANAFVEDRLACLDAGMNDHVPKPVDPPTMFATLLRWLPMPAPPPVPVPATATAQAAAANGASAVPLVERLSLVEGLAIAQVLTNFGGQVPVLTRVLQRFVATYADGLPALIDLGGAEAEGLRTWRAACLSARGALEAIGALALAADVMALEHALADARSRAEAAASARSVHARVQTLAGRLADELSR